MKTSLSFFLLIALIGTSGIVSLNGCKKGDEDPFISLRSRKARMAGEWKLSSGKSVEKYTDIQNSVTYTTSTEYNGSTATETFTMGSMTSTDTYSFTVQLNIKKDGTFTMVETDDGVVTNISGTWDFSMGTGKNLKKKEQLLLYYNNASNNTYNYTSTGYIQPMVYNIRRLANKELILDFDYTATSPSSTEELDSEWTYTQ